MLFTNGAIQILAMVFTAAMRMPDTAVIEKILSSANIVECLMWRFMNERMLFIHPLRMISPESETTTISRIQIFAIPAMPSTTAPLTLFPSRHTRSDNPNSPIVVPITTASTMPEKSDTKMLTGRKESAITTSVGRIIVSPNHSSEMVEDKLAGDCGKSLPATKKKMQVRILAVSTIGRR